MRADLKLIFPSLVRKEVLIYCSGPKIVLHLREVLISRPNCAFRGENFRFVYIHLSWANITHLDMYHVEEGGRPSGSGAFVMATISFPALSSVRPRDNL